jgi:Rrf2 family protein
MFSNRLTEYAIRGMSELASRQSQGFLMMDDLVKGTDLPRDFLAKIFQKLVHANLLKSQKGRNGGFALARAAHQITIMSIVEAVEGPQPYDRCVVGMEKCTDQMPCPQHDLYKPIRQRLKDYLNTTTVADLAASLRTKPTWQKAHLSAAER